MAFLTANNRLLIQLVDPDRQIVTRDPHQLARALDDRSMYEWDYVRLRKRRKSRHWSQTRLALEASTYLYPVSQQMVSAYERGSCRISDDILKRLVHALDAE